MFDWFSRDLFQHGLGCSNLLMEPLATQVGQVGMGHGMAANLKSQIAELSQLQRRQVAAFSKKSDRDVEGRSEIAFPEYGRCGNQVCLAAVIEGYRDSRIGRECERLAHA